MSKENENQNASGKIAVGIGKIIEANPPIVPIKPVEVPPVSMVSKDAISSASAKAGGKVDIRINKIPARVGETGGSETVKKKTPAEITAAAKSFAAPIDAIFGMVDKAGVRCVAIVARKSDYTKEEVSSIEKTCHMSPDSRDAAVGAASRIAARRVTNEEAFDWAVLVGCFGEWSTNIAMTVHDIRNSKKEMLRKEIMAELEAQRIAGK